MATLGTLVTRASARLKDPTFQAVSRAEVVAVINDAITHYKAKRFFFNDFEETINLTINNPLLVLVTNPNPALIFKTGGIVINYASTRWLTTKVSSNEYDAMNVQGSGIPFAWTFRDGQYFLYYYPDAAYSTVVRGLKNYLPLVNDSDSNDFTVEAESMILYQTLSRLYGEFRQDEKMEGYYTGRANDEFKTLKSRTQDNNGTGRIEVESL